MSTDVVNGYLCSWEAKQSLDRPGLALRAPGGWVSRQQAHGSGKVM